jgi:hypothetical protein
MPKYILKDSSETTIEAKKAKKDIVIDTNFGPTLVSAGNYVVTTADGSKICMTKFDLELLYKPIK